MSHELILGACIMPAFFLFFGLEYGVAWLRQQHHLITYERSVANISVGVAERLLNLFITGSFYGLYHYIHQHFALLEIPTTWWVWVLLLLATDFVWYWYHRLGHEVNLFWGAHIVHHQSEEFNYTVSARITTLQAVIRNLFWCVLPLAGFHPTMVISILVVHGTYSFFTHTQMIGKLGWLEQIFITPSHHGVHHAFEAIGLSKTAEQAFNMLRRGGTANIIGMIPIGQNVTLPGAAFLGEKRIQGSLMGSNRFPVDMPRLVDFYMSGKLKLDEMISQRIRLDQVNEGFADMKKGGLARSVIVFD